MPDKEWTLMFYLASDNPLTPSVVTQLKALKQAPFHQDVNVVAHFDPQVEDTPSHIFDVNLINKLRPAPETDIDFEANDPYVRTLMEDKLWTEQKDRNGKRIRDQLKEVLAKKNIAYDPPIPPNGVVGGTESLEGRDIGGTDRLERSGSKEPKSHEPGPKESLSTFLKFCSEKYSAKHYMLFILGHGMVVGNDIFLFDEHVDSDEQSLSLIGLGEVLNGFAQDIRNRGAEFELVSFHSCSVSGVELAHELQFDQRGQFKGTANYVLASQGPAFVGSWPYREILIRVINDVDRLRPLDKKARAIEIKKMLVKIHKYILHNSSDFLLAGYSFQLTLCDLNKVFDVTSTLKKLSNELIEGLDEPMMKNLILLAHWKSISFWHEMYTDLYDFCFCLRNLCDEFGTVMGEKIGSMEAIGTTCRKLLDLLKAGESGDDDKLIVRTDFAGPGYQYSHGLSVYFPWSVPARGFISTYGQYRFSATSWSEFLKKYFEETERATRQEEDEKFPMSPLQPRIMSAGEKLYKELQEDIVSICFNNEGPLNSSDALGTRRPLEGGSKVDPRDPMGDSCNCGSIKNYPSDMRRRDQRARKAADPAFPIGLKDLNIL